ncbi:hypothetical protein N7447_002660 [Penicillium robsamsonii]|uniref:uncharacterized protein n=1 Tax=Penicillium robsamsonii TaxID=1792511 RepID=UPI002549A26D|nr:uncharacterized protein N7447_002660 [Penicillium robsamsonii]KAJ5836634.1 hypothetical protein N7447_002660 [Penicillium robsamsonii]
MAQTRKNTTKKVNTPKTTNKKAAGKAATRPKVDMNKLFPPWGSEEALNQTANKYATDIILAVYHDINTYCNIERLAGENFYNCQMFFNMRTFTEGFVEREIGNYMACVESFKTEHGEFQPVTPNSRFLQFVTGLGWKMFAICAHAEAFRRGIKEADDRTWRFLIQKIQENRLSIEVYAHNRSLKWRNMIWIHQGYPIPGLPDMKPEIETYMQWKVDHPHHTVITFDGKLKEPTYKGKLQKHIGESIFDPKKWGGQKQDPTLRHMSDGSSANVGRACLMCGNPASCDCRVASRAGELVELREYPETGTGIRVLTRFNRGDILDLFVGELLPDSVEEVYPLSQCDDEPHTSPNTARILCTICPHEFGNWTRYISHSCRPSTSFVTRTIGNRVVCTVEAIRDIMPFEELTVGYGDKYWKGKDFECRCGHCDGSGTERGLLTESYARGPSGPPLIESTVGDHFAKIVAECGDRTAVISRHQNDRATYSSLDARSNALARGLGSVGVGKGERVGVMLGNSMEYAVATYALFKLGAILVPLNPSFNIAQVIAALGHLEASHLLISTESNLPRKKPRSNVPLLDDLVEDLHKSNLESALVPSLKKIIMVDNSEGRVDISSYKSLTPYASIMSQLTADGRPLPAQNLSPHEIVNIQFTSGTTSMPKAACLSHHSILNNGSQIGDRMLLTPNDIVCCPPPLFHCFGSILGYMATATHGSAIVFPSESFNARAALEAVQEEKCTALHGVPTMFLEQLSMIETKEISSEGFQHLRTGIAAGSSIPSEIMKKLHKVLNLTELTICYGMTETSPVSAMTTTNDPIDKRIYSVGKLMPHVEAKIVDPVDKKNILPIEKRGELAVSGYLLMKEYWDAPEKTAEVMIADESGKVWMHTGDEASMSPDGYISITGRIKDLIIRGGENIHPLEIENCLLAHGGVADVSVVGVPDVRYGEAVAAFVVARDQGSKKVTAEDIQQWVREKLSNHLIPKHVFFLGPLESFPKTASGKIQKFKLREKAIALLAKGAA